jgi:hypothetical protein
MLTVRGMKRRLPKSESRQASDMIVLLRVMIRELQAG